MIAFAARRLLNALAIVLFATIVSFVILRLAPGDPLLAAADGSATNAATRAMLRARYGLDQPLLVQAAAYFTRVARGDLGTSIVEQRPVATVLADALPTTLVLSGAGLCLAILLGIAIGTLQGWRPHDRLGALFGNALTALYTVPELVLAIVLLALFGVQLGLFPVGGMSDPLVELTGGIVARARDRVWHLTLPGVALALAWGAAIARQQRAAMREISDEQFVRTAYAKGVPGRTVWLHHAMRPALPTTIALIGTMLPALVGGTVVIEALFSWPGMGSLIVRAVGLRDYPVVAGAVVLVATAVAAGTLCTDLLVHLADPRSRDSTTT